jgi:hypothetical protein
MNPVRHIRRLAAALAGLAGALLAFASAAPAAFASGLLAATVAGADLPGMGRLIADHIYQVQECS